MTKLLFAVNVKFLWTYTFKLARASTTLSILYPVIAKNETQALLFGHK